MDAAGDEPVALHRAQGLGEHLLGDRGEVLEQLVVAAGAVAEREQDVDRPLRAEQADRVADEAPAPRALGERFSRARTGRDGVLMPQLL